MKLGCLGSGGRKSRVWGVGGDGTVVEVVQWWRWYSGGGGTVVEWWRGTMVEGVQWWREYSGGGGTVVEGVQWSRCGDDPMVYKFVTSTELI